MNKILINFAHPAKGNSKINMALRKAVENIDGVYMNDLYSNYPDFLIDVEKEQKLCEENDIIIFQHPLYWYSTPSIIKEWFDLVLEHGWAYGSKGNALKDKFIFQALSAGGDEDTYHESGFNKHTIRELTSPLSAAANLCKMNYLPPFCVFGVHRGLSEDKMEFFTSEYKKAILALRDGKIDMEKLKNSQYFNKNLDLIIKGEV